MKRSGKVFFKDRFAGIVWQDDDGCQPAVNYFLNIFKWKYCFCFR